LPLPQIEKPQEERGMQKTTKTNRRRPDMEQGREARNNAESLMSMFL